MFEHEHMNVLLVRAASDIGQSEHRQGFVFRASNVDDFKYSWEKAFKDRSLDDRVVVVNEKCTEAL